MSPLFTNSRFLLTLFATWTFLILLYYMLQEGRNSSIPSDPWSANHLRTRPKLQTKHPIQELIDEAKEKHVQLVDRQSATSEDAKAEYIRRYSQNPPPVFDRWFSYAKSQNSTIIDDFDLIVENLKPFRQVSPEILRKAVHHATQSEDLALRKCGFANGSFYGEGGWIVDAFGQLLRDVAENIPDVEFAFNVIDEPRSVMTQEMFAQGGIPEPKFMDNGHRSIWNVATAGCSRYPPTTRPKPSNIERSIPLVENWGHAKDACHHPDYAQMHGFFSLPASCLLTDAPLPILSQAAPSTFGDILYPSPWYTERTHEGDHIDENEPVWEDKSDTLYWAGSTTGSYSINGSWKHSHRQRFVQFTQTLNETKHKYMKQDSSGIWSTYDAIEDHSALFNVKLTAIIQCEDPDCAEQQQAFDVAERDDPIQQLHSRFVFDTDGNSFSGRFYMLLRSRSVVLKQTVLREWHDERLVPWVHFVPVSLGMEELPELMRWLTAEEEGRRAAREIAEQGREWYRRALRREDFTVYLYRLMLELARVLDEQREVGGQ